jgi:hypothetical protein
VFYETLIKKMEEKESNALEVAAQEIKEGKEKKKTTQV